MRGTRRWFVKVAGVGIGSVLLASCGGGATPTPIAAPASSPVSGTTPTPAPSPTAQAATATPTRAASRRPFRVGVILTMTGSQASLGESQRNGMEYYLSTIDAAAGDWQIELVVEDSAGKPDQALTKAQKLVERDHVQALAGIILSSEAAALRDYVVEKKIPCIIGNAGLVALACDPAKKSEFIFNVAKLQGQAEAPLARYAVEKLGYKRMVLTAPDYTAGHNRANVFKNVFERAGGTVVDAVFPPQGTQDFGPYLQRILQQQADAVWAFYSGEDAVRFVQQYVEFGVRDRFPLIATGDTVDENILEQQGDAALGVLSVLHYSPLYESEANRRFVAEYRAKYGAVPNQFSYQGYLNARVIGEALQALGGQATFTTEAFLQALRAARFAGPVGEFRFEPESQFAIVHALLRRVERLPDGTLGNVVLEDLGTVTVSEVCPLL
ncbi:MAG: ABC transporter substrate-binding protein [Thermomicrobium sp.]|nr:ABC transporter substrate-binding protein [Thermomicrobium sp.]MDW8059764.1 ABC transporter substrate-binding protein [Thermomicrobium sp.]